MQQFIDTHDLSVVGLSYPVSAFGAFAAMYVAHYITDDNGNIRFGWLTLAPVVFGGCAIWAMYFTGMPRVQMDFAAGLAVYLTLLIGSALVMFRKAQDLEPDCAAAWSVACETVRRCYERHQRSAVSRGFVRTYNLSRIFLCGS